jgi:hypothetical protein
MFMSEGTRLSNNPGNLSSKLRQMTTMDTVIMVALLPIIIKNGNILQKQLNVEGQTHREVVNEILQWILHSLTINQNPSS